MRKITEKMMILKDVSKSYETNKKYFKKENNDENG